LDLSLDAFTLVGEFKHNFFIAIILKTGLDEVITSHLDTSFATAILRCSGYHHDLWVNNAVDKRPNGGEWIREEVGCSLEGEITSLARGSVSSIDALAINVVVFTWFLTSASFSTELFATDCVINELSVNLFWLTEYNLNDTGNQSWSICICDLVGDSRALFTYWCFWVIFELVILLSVLAASIHILREIGRSKAASERSRGGISDIISEADECTGCIDNLLSLSGNSLACIRSCLVYLFDANSFLDHIEVWNIEASLKEVSISLLSKVTAAGFLSWYVDEFHWHRWVSWAHNTAYFAIGVVRIDRAGGNSITSFFARHTRFAADAEIDWKIIVCTLMVKPGYAKIRVRSSICGEELDVERFRAKQIV
jgi:hypothetical protein